MNKTKKNPNMARNTEKRTWTLMRASDIVKMRDEYYKSNKTIKKRNELIEKYGIKTLSRFYRLVKTSTKNLIRECGVRQKPKAKENKMDAQNFTADFGTAIKWLKEGKKVARKDWNGKNMWLVFMPPFRVEEPNERTQAHGIKEAFDCGGYIVMWTAQGVRQPGWIASQPDMLSEDWGIAE